MQLEYWFIVWFLSCRAKSEFQSAFLVHFLRPWSTNIVFICISSFLSIIPKRSEYLPKNEVWSGCNNNTHVTSIHAQCYSWYRNNFKQGICSKRDRLGFYAEIVPERFLTIFLVRHSMFWYWSVLLRVFYIRRIIRSFVCCSNIENANYNSLQHCLCSVVYISGFFPF